MLQPAPITALLAQLINHTTNNNDDSISSIRPHTALLTLLDSSQLYAVATRLVDAPPPRSTVPSILASTAPPTRSPPPQSFHAANGRPAPLTLDERAACLSAIAVTSWRQATESGSPSASGKKATKEGERARARVVMPGSSVHVAKHPVTGMTSSSGNKATSRELVPLLLESDLGRILIMPIVPARPTLSPSRSELAAIDDSHDHTPSFADHQKPFMLLTLNAPAHGPPPNLLKSPSTPNQTSTSAAVTALASSTATLSATTPARSRLRSGGITPTSTRSDNNTTPCRSPISENFPPGTQCSSSPLPSPEADLAPPSSTTQSGTDGEQGAAVKEWEAKLWSGLYAQAKALARVLAPSLTKCGVGQQHHVDDNDAKHAGGGLGSGAGLSEDEAEA